MAYTIKKVDVWAGEIADRPGGLADKLSALSDAGDKSRSFSFRVALPTNPAQGFVFLAPIKGAKQKGAAQAGGLTTTDSLHSVRVEGPDRAGLGTKMSRAVADAGINLRGISAAALGRRAVTYFAFDSAADADTAIRVLKKALK